MIFNIIIPLFMVVYLLIAITTAINPYYIWRITQSWKATKEPSKEYFIFMRIGGFVGIVMGIFIIIAFLKMK